MSPADAPPAPKSGDAMSMYSATPVSYSADGLSTLTSAGAPPAAPSTSATFPAFVPPASVAPPTAGHVAGSRKEEPRDAPKGPDPTSLVHRVEKQGPETGDHMPSGVEIKQKRDPTLPKPPKKTGIPKKPKQKGEPTEDGVGYRLPSHPPGSAPYPRPGSGIPPPPVPPSLSMSASSSANFGGSAPGTAQPSRPPSASTKPQHPPSRPSYPMEVGESPVYLASQMPDAYPSYPFTANFAQQHQQATPQNPQNPPQHVSYAPLSMPPQPSPLPPLATTPYYPPGPPSAKPVYPPFPPFSTTPVTTTPTYPPLLKPASSGAAGSVPHEATKREKVHLSVIDRLYRIENDFLERKDVLYEQKALELRRELQEIQRSVHPQYMDKARELETQYNTALRETNDQKKYLDACLERAAKSDRELAKKELEEAKAAAKDNLLKSIEEKRIKLTEEREALTIDSVEALPESQTQNTRSGKGRPARNRRGDSAAPSDVNGSVAPGSPGPVIMYAGSGKKKRAYIVEKVAPPQNGLTEEEINEDLLYLQKLGAFGRRSKKSKR